MVASCQNRSPWTHMFSVFSGRAYSQAGRRRFESGLPLHLFNRLLPSPNQLLSHLSQLTAGCPDFNSRKAEYTVDTAACFRASEDLTYMAMCTSSPCPCWSAMILGSVPFSWCSVEWVRLK